LQIREWDKQRENDEKSGAKPGRFGTENRAEPGVPGGLVMGGALGGRALFAGQAPHRMVGQNYRPGYPFQMDFFLKTGGYFRLFASCAKFGKFIKISFL